MFGWWQTLEHFSAPGSHPIATSADAQKVVQHALGRATGSQRSRPVLARRGGDDWNIHGQIGSAREMSGSQRAKYDRARRGGTRGNLGPIPPDVELYRRTQDLDAAAVATKSTHDDLLAELGNLTRARYNGVSAPYKLLVLQWAVNRALDGGSRLVRLSSVRREIANILSPYRIGTSAPKPSDPWSALDGSAWWERTVTPDGDLGGLSLPVYRLIQEDRGFGRRAIGVLDRLIAESPPAEATAPARLAQAEEPVISVTPLQIERNLVATFAIEQPGREMTALRREAGLVERYADHLRSKGHEVHRDMIVLRGSERLYTDLYDETDHCLYEAKASTDRMAIRLGLGQVLDYRRFLSPRSAALLLPDLPGPDLCELLGKYDVRVCYPSDDGWATV